MGATDACTGFLLKFPYQLCAPAASHPSYVSAMSDKHLAPLPTPAHTSDPARHPHEVRRTANQLQSASCRSVIYWNCKDCSLNCKSPRFRSRKSASVDAGSAVAAAMTAADCTALCRSEE